MPNAPQTHRPTGWVPRAERDRYRGSSRDRGYDRDWEKVRAEHIAEHPLCVWCENKGLTVAVEIVDHIIPITVRPDLRLEGSNLQSLCRSCHGIKTHAEQST